MTDLIGAIFLISVAIIMLMIIPATYLFSRYMERKYGIRDLKKLIIYRYFYTADNGFNFFSEFSVFMKEKNINFIFGILFYGGLVLFGIVFVLFLSSVLFGYVN